MDFQCYSLFLENTSLWRNFKKDYDQLTLDYLFIFHSSQLFKIQSGLMSQDHWIIYDDYYSINLF
jgi:hypothetical protein